MEENKLEQQLRELFQKIDIEDSGSLKKEQIENLLILSGLGNREDVEVMADQIYEEWSLSPLEELSSERFAEWMKFKLSTAMLKGNAYSILEQITTPAIQVIDFLTSIREDLPESKHHSLDWAISQIKSGSLYTLSKEKSELIKSQFLEKETADILEDYYPTRRNTRINSKFSGLSLRSSNSIQELDQVSEFTAYQMDLDSFDLDVAQMLEDLGSMSTVLNYMSYKIFEYWDLFNLVGFNERTFTRFIHKVSKGYQDNPYHNALHAADMSQACHCFMVKTNIQEKAQLTPLHTSSLFLSAFIHDYKHPGYNNSFLQKTSDDLAIRYNDISVLENYHVAEAFALTKNSKYNLFETLDPEDYKAMRELIIRFVLGTDMSKHSSHVAEAQTRLQTPDLPQERSTILGLFLHAADLSNPCRSYTISEKWAFRVSEEFFLQGDYERKLGLPVSSVCNRDSVNIAKSQVGFINAIAMPLFLPLVKRFPELGFLKENLEFNREKWAGRIQEFQKSIST